MTGNQKEREVADKRSWSEVKKGLVPQTAEGIAVPMRWKESEEDHLALSKEQMSSNYTCQEGFVAVIVIV